jgi:uncharacterized damage-inducible protein DinB
MTLSEEIQDLVRYDEWANARLVEASRGLPQEGWSTPVASSFGSLRETFAHIVGAEWIWLQRWKGEGPASGPDWLKSEDREELVARLREVEEERRSWLVALPAEELESRRSYRTLSGTEYHHVLADQIRHVVNHSTYHRGQAATQIRQLGHVPPSTDLILYRRDTEPADHGSESHR